MIRLAKATDPSEPKTSNIRPLGFSLAALFFLMVVSQVLSIGTFIDTVHLASGVSMSWAAIVAGVIVGLEVAAVPFLIGLKLSPLMRIASLKSGFLVLLVWIVITIHNLVAGTAETLGYLGGRVTLVPGWWAVWFLIGLLIIQTWVSWGWWPDELVKNKEIKNGKKVKRN